MNKIISIIALLLILPIFKVEAYDFVIDEITYNFTKEHGTVEVSGLREFLNLEPGDRNSSLPLVVNIPPVVTYKDNKYDVVSIGYAAFQGCTHTDTCVWLIFSDTFIIAFPVIYLFFSIWSFSAGTI